MKTSAKHYFLKKRKDRPNFSVFRIKIHGNTERIEEVMTCRKKEIVKEIQDQTMLLILNLFLG